MPQAVKKQLDAKNAQSGSSLDLGSGPKKSTQFSVRNRNRGSSAESQTDKNREMRDEQSATTKKPPK